MRGRRRRGGRKGAMSGVGVDYRREGPLVRIEWSEPYRERV